MVVELFAGVGGFRLGLEGVPGRRRREPDWQVAWSNQWEPSTRRQDASSCYVRRFGAAGHSSVDITAALDHRLDGHEPTSPEVARVPPLPAVTDLLVGGFPCQDYSVAKSRSRASGIAGGKGVLWWQIERLLRGSDGLAGRPRVDPPKYVLLENVDRLLKSPASRRGHDFAVMLATFALHDYDVQWRVVDASTYGNPQRRKRVFILAERRADSPAHFDEATAGHILTKTGTLARSLRVEGTVDSIRTVRLPVDVRAPLDLVRISERFHTEDGRSPFADSGVMIGGSIVTGRTFPKSRRRQRVLGDVLIADDRVPDEFLISDDDAKIWKSLKAGKTVRRVSHRDGRAFSYDYSEGNMSFPDKNDRPSRTILTGEGGRTPSRFKHVVAFGGGGYRRLTPGELERLQGFPPGWTAKRADGSLIPDTRRAFFMGNALVVDIVRRIGRTLAEDRRNGRATHGL